MTIPVLRQSPACEFARIAPAGFRIIAALDHCTQVIAHDLTITAGTNDHTTGRHPLGEAFDVRTRDLLPAQILRVRQVLQSVLGPRFTVLYETPTKPTDPMLVDIATINPEASAPHFHVQAKKGTTYPPMPDVSV
jgi:hypothetical protein